MAKPRRYTKAYAQEQAKLGNTKEPVASTVYLTLDQLKKVERLIEKRQKEDSAKLNSRAIACMPSALMPAAAGNTASWLPPNATGVKTSTTINL